MNGSQSLDSVRQLSLMAQYSIRRLLHRRRDRLRLVAAPGRHLSAIQAEDLNDVLEGLYLDDERINQAVSSLESYVQMHHRLRTQLGFNAMSVELERRIFSLLGLRLEEEPLASI